MLLPPRRMVYLENTSVDAASFVSTTWWRGGDSNQFMSVVDLQFACATACTLTLVYSVNSLGTTPFATLNLEGGATLVINTLYNWSVLSTASTYWNLQPTATTTVKVAYAADRKVW